MKTAWRWLAGPACLVLLGAAVSARRTGDDRPEVYRDWPALCDRKLERTFRDAATPEERAALGDDTHQAVGRPGLRVELTMSAAQREYVRSARKDMPRRDEEIAVAFDGGPARTATVSVRGWSTQSTDRKSYMVRLFQRQQFTSEIRLRKFLLVNLLYDQGAFRMETCYRLLGGIGLFPGYHELVTVFVNGHAEGVYLLVERVEDAVRRTEPRTIAVIRRRWNEVPELKFAGPGADTGPVERLAAADAPRGPHLDELSRLVDLDRYMGWLAFNSLVRNGDFADEVFFYQTAAPAGHLPQPLRPVAWDYDDVFHAPGHPKKAFGDSLLYACETHLDRRILADPVLHTRYAAILRGFLATDFTPVRVQAVLAAVHAALDGIDTGEPAAVQTAHRAQRDREIQQFENDFRARHAQLSRSLDS